MNSLKIFISLLLALALPLPALAAVPCYLIDGAAIYGQTSSGDFKFIGGIFNKYDSSSIANKYGKGNKYVNDSIFNKYGSFGNKYSSYSALNKYASNPPIMVDSDYNFLGYLSISGGINTINTYTALYCAGKSYVTDWTD